MDIAVTDAQIREASRLYTEQIGTLAVYTQLPRPMKEMIAAMVVGSVAHLRMEQVHEAATNDDEFHGIIMGIILGFEATHPDKINPFEQLSQRVAQIVRDGMDWEGLVPPDEVVFCNTRPTAPPAEFEDDIEFDAIVRAFYDDGSATQ